jgi:hypothetical protein
MRVEHVEFLLEEESMMAFLNGLLPRAFPELDYQCHPLGGKNEFLKRVPQRLKGYATWIPETWRIIVMVDQNGQDCHTLKTKLEDFAQTSGLPTMTRPRGEQAIVINRIVVPCLEAWYFGDWEAVHQAYPRVPEEIPRKALFRKPDAIPNPKQSLEQIMKKAGYFRTGFREKEAAENISPYLEPERNTSHSFQVFYRTLQSILGVRDANG